MYGLQHFIWIYLAGDIVWDAAGNAVRIIGSLTDITEKKTDEARIIQLAYHDGLTGLPNRLLFKERLNQTMEDRRRDNKQLAVMMIDLDRFKIVNDTLGHQTGDSLLQLAANSMKECLVSEIPLHDWVEMNLSYYCLGLKGRKM